MRASTRGRRLRSTPRPRDRRDQLAAIAADLFRRNGYHNVGVNDIAAAAGITGPAVYRHFPSKQAILGHVVLAGLDRFTAVITAAMEDSADATPAAHLQVLAASISRLVVERRDLGALWRREGRNLPAADRAALALLARRATRFGVHVIQRVRPDLSDVDADLLCWAILSVYGSVSEHQVSLPRARFERLLTELALTVAACPAVPTPSDGISHPYGRVAGPDTGDTDAGGRVGGVDTGDTDAGGRVAGVDTGHTDARRPVPRREQLLTLAARMFCEHGFHAVTMEGIGAAAGISGPSIYRHYASKADLLVAMCGRVADRLRTGVDTALGGALAPPDALRALATSFVDTVLDHRDLVAAYLMEGDNLPDRDRTELRRLQRAYLTEWVSALVASHPTIDEKCARVRVHAAFTVVNDLARDGRFAERPGLAGELVELAMSVLVPAAETPVHPQ